MKITPRDIKVFLLGMLAMFLLDLAFGWEDFIQGIQDGYHTFSK